MAEQFYDINHAARRALHRAYIRQCLDAFADNTNVIHCISAEYSGPQHFVTFWLDVIMEWEKETGRNALVALSTPKDVQDAILQDAVHAAAVDIIDIRYWHYRDDGSVYAPAGGQNLAPRQQARTGKPGRSSFEQVYRAVREYREKYPDKIVTYSSEGSEANGWAALMAGGSLASIPAIKAPAFAIAAAAMKPMDLPDKVNDCWLLGNRGKEYILFIKCAEATVKLPGAQGSCRIQWINPPDGQVLREEKNVRIGESLTLRSPGTNGGVAWITIK
jgi:hypothetical protein